MTIPCLKDRLCIMGRAWTYWGRVGRLASYFAGYSGGVILMSDELCGHTKNNGEPCTYPPKHDDGKCGIHTSENNQGRPSKFNEERENQVLQSAANGLSKAGCARAAGVGKATLERWLDEHESFRNSFARARNQGERQLVSDGLRDPDTDSSMAKFLLSTSFDYVKTERREHTGPDGESLEVKSEVVTVTEDDLD